ncbi:Uncharacterised protein [Rothia kristinae]|nr:Uncharacterised protein [Rothia kristinae]
MTETVTVPQPAGDTKTRVENAEHGFVAPKSCATACRRCSWT